MQNYNFTRSNSIMIFSWEFSKLLQSIIFRNIFICLENFSYIKNYLKNRSETRRGRRSTRYFVLRNRREHLYYTRRRRSAKYEKFIKTSLKYDQDRLNWKFFCENKTTLFSSFCFFVFIMYLPRNSILCYAFIIPSILEEFRPVSA